MVAEETTRRTLAGIGVARGIAIGRAHLLAPSELEVRQVTIERRDVVHEIARLTRAFAAVREELDDLKAGLRRMRRPRCARSSTCTG